ncbi:GNAT family N-acetyltransferase [Methylobacterium pseudosasicola]|uniref:Acetyltransferase (GNAT) family protein n=1 Tax=Methylobacterium pseudosasicola TaxID=582667 RepID=A0A1I4PNI8_9HYPH|nr:GNAT family N-acetyltransferase [Methylobacterium pseudosasicola]SFM29367.1 Acetyltransferase (GNAT) family protein [Methylobacterium pseudosasicola]
MPSDPATPLLPVGFSALPPGHIAAIVTSLDMVGPPTPRAAKPLPDGMALHPLVRSDCETYRGLYRAVGADWLWFSRLTLSDQALRDILDDPRVEILTLRQDGTDLGLLELDFRQPETCELAFLGLVPEALGQGLGRTLINTAIESAWSHPIKRFWVHTCTFDHPGALDFYRRSGFTPCAVAVEVAPDPRLTGLLPRTCAPHVPLLA